MDWLQELYKKEVEERVRTLQKEHEDTMSAMVKDLDRMRSEQAGQLQDVMRLREQLKLKAEHRVRELTEEHETDMRQKEGEWMEEVEKWKSEVSSTKLTLQTELDRLRQSHQTELEAVRAAMEKKVEHLKEKYQADLETIQLSMTVEQKKGSVEKERWENQSKQREESLTQQVSNLTKELRTSKDQLALAQQRITELGREISESSSLRSQLDQECERSDELRREIQSLRDCVETSTQEEKRWKKKFTEKDCELASECGRLLGINLPSLPSGYSQDGRRAQ